MTPEKFKEMENLITDYGNYSYDCGEWQERVNDSHQEPYNCVLARFLHSKEILWNFLKENCL